MTLQYNSYVPACVGVKRIVTSSPVFGRTTTPAISRGRIRWPMGGPASGPSAPVDGAIEPLTPCRLTVHLDPATAPVHLPRTRPDEEAEPGDEHQREPDQHERAERRHQYPGQPQAAANQGQLPRRSRSQVRQAWRRPRCRTLPGGRFRVTLGFGRSTIHCVLSRSTVALQGGRAVSPGRSGSRRSGSRADGLTFVLQQRGHRRTSSVAPGARWEVKRPSNPHEQSTAASPCSHECRRWSPRCATRSSSVGSIVRSVRYSSGLNVTARDNGFDGKILIKS